MWVRTYCSTSSSSSAAAAHRLTSIIGASTRPDKTPDTSSSSAAALRLSSVVSASNRQRHTRPRPKPTQPDQTPTLLDRPPPSFDRRDSFPDRPRPSFDRQEASFDRQETSFDRRETTFDRQGASFDRRGASFDRRETTFDRQGASFDRRDSFPDRRDTFSDRQRAPFDRRDSSPDHGGNSFERRRIEFDRHGIEINRRDTFPDCRGNSFDRSGIGINRRDAFPDHRNTSFDRSGIEVNHRGTEIDRRHTLINRPETFTDDNRAASFDRRGTETNRPGTFSDRRETFTDHRGASLDRSKIETNRPDTFSDRQEASLDRQGASFGCRDTFPDCRGALLDRRGIEFDRRGTEFDRGTETNRPDTFPEGTSLDRRDTFPNRSGASSETNRRGTFYDPRYASYNGRRFPEEAAELFQAGPEEDDTFTGKNLRSMLMTFNRYKYTMKQVLDRWRRSHMIRSYKLNLIIRELRNLGRYRDALEVCEWRTNQGRFRMQVGDYSIHLDLVSKVHGIEKTEEFFKEIPYPMANAYSHTTLLHCYVRNNMVDKAEALLAKMFESDMVINALPFNHMLSLYMENRQLEKVPEMIQKLKNFTTPDVVTYTLWLTYCLRQNDLKTAEQVLSEMEDKVEPNWVTYSVLVNLYLKNGLREKAICALKELERSAPLTNRNAILTSLILHADVGDKLGVHRTWDKLLFLFSKQKESEYIGMIDSLLKLDELKEAENLYAKWELVSKTKDSTASDLLLAAYVKRDKMRTAAKFYKRMTKSGIKASYTTYMLLTRGYSKEKNVEKALHYFEATLKSMPKWRPNIKLVTEVFNAIEEKGNIEGAEKLLDVLRKKLYSATWIYNSLLRTYAIAGKIPESVEERMRKDKVRMDEETHELIKSINKKCVT